MSIFFSNPEQAIEHYKQDHGIDFEFERLARRFDGKQARGYSDIVEAAHLLHGQNEFATVNEVLNFFDKHYNYTNEVWAAVATEAGVHLDECDECD